MVVLKKKVIKRITVRKHVISTSYNLIFRKVPYRNYIMKFSDKDDDDSSIKMVPTQVSDLGLLSLIK